MSKHARDIVVSDPLRCPLDAQEWQTARERAARLGSARDRRQFFALLNYMEQGWEIVRPLHAAANRSVCCPGPGGRTAEDVTAFIECDPIDVYRGITHTCMRVIQDAPQGPPNARFEIVADEAGDVARYLRILALGADHPDFPPELRALVRSAAAAMTRWHAGLAEVLEPADGGASARPMRRSRGARGTPPRQAAASAARRRPLRSVPSSRNE
jgi:hypothetical protein